MRSREFTHRVKSVSMATFTSQEVEALQKGGNQVNGYSLNCFTYQGCVFLVFTLKIFAIFSSAQGKYI